MKRCKSGEANNVSVQEVLLDAFAIFCFIVWFWLLITVAADLFRRHDISGWIKAIWVIAWIVFPYLGVLAYLIFQGRGYDAFAAHSRRDASGGRTADAEQQTNNLNRYYFDDSHRWKDHGIADIGTLGRRHSRGIDQNGRIAGRTRRNAQEIVIGYLAMTEEGLLLRQAVQVLKRFPVAEYTAPTQVVDKQDAASGSAYEALMAKARALAEAEGSLSTKPDRRICSWSNVWEA